MNDYCLCTGSFIELLGQLQNALTRLQPHLAQKQDKYKARTSLKYITAWILVSLFFQESLKECLKSLGESFDILQLLPESLLLENYVYLWIETEK